MAAESAPAQSSGPIARVLVDSPLPQLDRLFDYRIPEHLAGAVKPGVRVTVPLRTAGRIADGFIIEVIGVGGGDGIFAGALSELDSIVSVVDVLRPEVWRLARAAADRAAGSAIDIVRLAVPKRQVRVEKAHRRADGGQPADRIMAGEATGYEAGIIETAIAETRRIAVDALPGVVEVGETGRTVWVGRWAVSMAAAAASTVRAGKTAILVVPDYRDQRQVEAALRAVLPADSITPLDATQPTASRYRNFLDALDDRARVIVGTRSVVYAPAADLGLIAIWDDGDSLHAEPLSPYVHSRDAALLRQEQQSCALAFFGYARSSEVERLVEIGWVIPVSPSPSVHPRVIPTSQQAGGDPRLAAARIPSTAWATARQALETGPVLVQVGTPGYAPRLACAECGRRARCLRCDGPLGKTSSSATPACGWCGALAVDWHCTECDGTRMRLAGAGATRTAEDLGRAFPGVRVILSDGERRIIEIGPEPALVIATRGAEPIAAGGYHAILLLDGERMMTRESLRVGEDCIRWWSNAVALGASGATSVLVGVGGSEASTMATWRQADYARAELTGRRGLRFPPIVRVATVSGQPEAVSAAVAALDANDIDVLGPVEIDARGASGEPSVRTIVRFDYARGPAVAASLRAAVIRSAGQRRKPGAGRATPPRLRVHFDDLEPFEDV